jgi:hypothetical protein
MPWLTTYGPENLITDGESRTPEHYYVFMTGTHFKRDIITIRQRYVGMTEAAADTCVDALDDPLAEPAVHAEKMRENDAGAYTVILTTRTEGAWEEVIET